MNQKTIWRIHSITGVYAGVIIAFLSLTGVAALFRWEFEQLINPDLALAEPIGPKVSLNDAVQKVRALHPNNEFFEVEFLPEAEGTWIVKLRPEKKDKLFPMLLEVFVNPYTGEILGERNYYESFTYYLRNIHVRFYEGYIGRQIVGLAGLALLITTITGFLIYGNFMKKQFFAAIRNKNLRLQQADLHKFIGVLTLIFNLVIAVSGTWLGLQPYLEKAFGIERPNTYVKAEKPLDKAADIALNFNFDSVYNAGRRYFPELIPVRLRPSVNGERSVTILGDVPRQVYERFNNKVVVDKQNYSLLYKYNISEGTLGSKIYYVQEALHFGDFGGIGLKIFYCIMGLGSGFLSLSGFVVYLERNKKQRKQKPSYVEVWPLVIRWSLGIVGYCVIIGILSINYGIGVPAIIVTVLMYTVLIVYLVKVLIGFFKKRASRNKPVSV
ncbi:PepSY-associated TM helix domain-containing protein [Chondrinema litorale]|uniref:PepSY-associated TM helix domain-containing protein n=1 Tax=Chondrinema litorale TaxID=2994555 RepID=UPI002543AB18|nr:PepSY-associated TM helix domain-containing protein [Chondrinema litorale]UZR99450.1 PepSY-associated TM helix domain-containing protein [Chondrinema litorale]